MVGSLALVTVERENTVLYLLTARYEHGGISGHGQCGGREHTSVSADCMVRICWDLWPWSLWRERTQSCICRLHGKNMFGSLALVTVEGENTVLYLQTAQ
ncbi:hypothetical protein DPMN_128303 [Dreissena polymorpha]|uniref:Uncharacterized protein n=1 Tax=Dreissena polymorpha TaxID=45954 RepID=A0A9D4JX97_DREPO|nr:hypothetical protein DPMN_128303 [Dreissena polymorpha]